MNRGLFVLIVATVAAAAALGCGDGRYSFALEHEGKILLACPNATVSDLSPAGGGFRLTCVGGDKEDLYLVNGTGAGGDGTLKYIWASSRTLERQTYLPALDGAEGGTVDCPSARSLGRKTGETPVPDRTYGTWKLAMSRPCGEVTLTIAAPIEAPGAERAPGT